MAKYRLWTPIANAFDAYRRRLISEPTAFYEHTWRLIHIQESLVVTLGSALVSRLLYLWKDEPNSIEDMKKLRKMVIDCLENGSIGNWNDILSRFGRLTAEKYPPCPFIAAVKEYLEEIPTINPNKLASKQQGVPLAFLTTWQSIAPVTSNYEDNNLSRLGRFFAINSLRNKIAHVPISGDTFRKLHTGLRREVLSLLTPLMDWQAEPPTANPNITKWHPPLCGQIANKRSYVTGSADYGQVLGIDDDKTYWEWQKIGNQDPERWLASPFVYIDNDIKVSLLFKLEGLNGEPDENLNGQYHRFAAEARYERSKAFYHLSLIMGKRNFFDDALKDAERAAKSGYKTEHANWEKFLQRKRDEEGIESTISGVNIN
ncbi:hypothetical protein LC607_14810 [Nostoc sp. CHAB 5824]|nr:hypothetical protein [Nostoc sp. CHAB 5824]